MNEPPPLSPSNPKDRRHLKIGFAVGIAVVALPCLITAITPGSHPENGIVMSTLLAFVIIQIIAIPLAISRGTRKFGLGLLLADGFSLLALLAICGGGFVNVGL